MAYGEFNDLPRRTASDTILCDKAYNIAKNQKMMDVKEVVLHWFTYFLIKVFWEWCQKWDYDKPAITEELYKPIIRTLTKIIEKTKIILFFQDNIFDADLVDMHLISKFNKRFLFLLCVIHYFSKYAWVVPLKDKKGITIINALKKSFRRV